jgi:hypothetical protein
VRKALSIVWSLLRKILIPELQTAMGAFHPVLVKGKRGKL